MIEQNGSLFKREFLVKMERPSTSNERRLFPQYRYVGTGEDDRGVTYTDTAESGHVLPHRAN
jgi:hypothetical protein